jgi:PIN domain nuclease of toxin-antitoxin system
MIVLLDTHSWLWSVYEPDKLSLASREHLLRAERILLSVASLWEVTIKSSLGKLPLPHSIRELVDISERHFLYGLLSIEVRHLEALHRLKWSHRDPFDRMLVAQAGADGLALLTADRELTKDASLQGVSVEILPA